MLHRRLREICKRCKAIRSLYFYIAQSRTNKRNKETDLSTQIQINLFVASVTIGLQWFVPHHADVEIAFVEGFATKLLAHSTNKQAKRSLGYTLILKNIIGLMLYLRINRMKNRHIADITKLSQFLLLSKSLYKSFPLVKKFSKNHL